MTREEAIKYGIEWLEDEYLDANDRAFIKIALEALEQEPCEDAISRQAVIDITWENPSYTDALNVLTEVRDKVEALQSVTPQPKMAESEDK